MDPQMQRSREPLAKQPPSVLPGSASASLSTSSLNDGTGSTNVRDGTMSAPPVIRRYSNSSDAQAGMGMSWGSVSGKSEVRWVVCKSDCDSL